MTSSLGSLAFAPDFAFSDFTWLQDGDHGRFNTVVIRVGNLMMLHITPFICSCVGFQRGEGLQDDVPSL